MTIIEVLISLSILTVFSLGLVVAAQESYDAYKSTTTNSSTETRLRNAVQRASRELMGSSVEVLFPQDIDDGFGTDDLVFQQPVGVDVPNEAPSWGPMMRLRREYDRGELDDGIDNDGDGLVDEGILVLIRDDGGPTETRVVLCNDVRELGEGEQINNADDNGNGVSDEGGFNLHRVGNVLTLTLTLEETHEQAGTVVRTLSSTVRLRN